MPINRKHNITFIHIPKTGGSTVEHLMDMNNEDSLWFVDGKLEHGRSVVIDGVMYAPQHFTWDIISKEYPKFYENSIKFTFVRNPYTRLLSEYFWLHKKIKIFDPELFDVWVKDFLSNIDNDHKLPQHRFIPENIDFIGKTENLTQDLQNLIKKYNLPFTYNGDIIGNTSHNKEKLIHELKSDSIDLINDVYNDDFIKFNYKKIKT